MKNMLWILNIFLAIGLANAANILIVLPLPLYSHTNTFMPIFKELATRGHNITMVSPYPQKQTIPNWTDVTIDISIFKEYMDETITEFMNLHIYKFYFAFWKFCTNAMKLAYHDKTLQKVIHSEECNYDLLILEPFFAQESLIAFGHKMNVPVIALHPISVSPWLAYLTGNEFSFSLFPNYRTAYTSQMTLIQRLDNMFINLIEFTSAYFYYLPQQESLMENYMVYSGHNSRPPMLDMLKNVSLTLIDYHHSIGYVSPLQPNTIPIGGLSLKHANKLPKDLKNIIEESKNTVIYLSFGSHVHGVSDNVLKSLLEAFAELDHKVLMKWPNENVTSIPKNVEIRKWFPQPSILAHPKVQLFISHGGLHGVTEASFCGIPILGIPFFSDQEFNLRFVEQVGTGLTLLQKDVNKKSLLKAIRELLNNPSYRETALKRSRLVNDRPQTPLESSVYWIEYVLRHNGAKHLRPARLDLSIHQEQLMRKYLSYEKYDFPPLLDMLHNISLTLVDSHFSFGYVRPYLPHTIEVGGLTIDGGGELSEELQDYLDSSENGFIYFTFGSIMNIASLPAEMKEVFMSVCARLKQNVVMRWEGEEHPSKPKNIKTMPWLPQKRILAHPNCRLFISHGGFHGLTEALYHKVPLVIIPFFSDQYYNALLAHKEGFAYVLDNHNITTENLLLAINTSMDNPEFKKNLERKSLILKDKDQKPVDKAVYWVEYVLRHNGAKHLKPASLNLNLFQYFLLDVILVILLIIIGCLCLLILVEYILIKILIFLFKHIYKSNNITITREAKQLSNGKLKNGNLKKGNLKNGNPKNGSQKNKFE